MPIDEKNLSSMLDAITPPPEVLAQAKGNEAKLLTEEYRTEQEARELLFNENSVLRQQVKDLIANRWMRIGYASLSFGYLAWYTIRVLCMIERSAEYDTRFYLSDSVMIALGTTTMIQAIGLVMLISRGLFSIQEKKN